MRWSGVDVAVAVAGDGSRLEDTRHNIRRVTCVAVAVTRLIWPEVFVVCRTWRQKFNSLHRTFVCGKVI